MTVYPGGKVKIIRVLVVGYDKIYTVSQKNVPPLACYNFDEHEWILIFFWQKCYR